MGKLWGCHSPATAVVLTGSSTAPGVPWQGQDPVGSQGDRDNPSAHEKHPEEEYFPAEPRCCQSWQMNNLSDPGRYKPSLDPSGTLVPITLCTGGRISQVHQVPPGPSSSPRSPGTASCSSSHILHGPHPWGHLGWFGVGHSDFSPSSSPAGRTCRANDFSLNQIH